LDTFRSTTQFIVVTHNKGTMAHAQRLYGVTMQTKGVSRQVEVDLSDVDDFVPDEARAASIKVLPRIEDPPEVPEISRLKDYDVERTASLERSSLEVEGSTVEELVTLEDDGESAEREPELLSGLDAETRLDAETGEPVVELKPSTPAGESAADETAVGASTTEDELSISPESLG
jgi:hypothetical protein